MGSYCKHCGERIVKTADDNYKDWRHKNTGSAFCKKVRGKKVAVAEPRETSSPAGVSLEVKAD